MSKSHTVNTKSKVKVQMKFTLEQATKTQRGQLYSFFKLEARCGGWSTPRHGPFTLGKDTLPIVQEAGWAPGSAWTDAENLVPTGIRSPDRPARSASLYRLRYPNPLNTKGYHVIVFFLKKRINQLQVLHDLQVDDFVMCKRKYSLPDVRHYSDIRMKDFRKTTKSE